MSVAIGRRRWAPPITAKIDRGHSIGQGLVAAYLPRAGLGAIDLTGGPSLALIGSPAHGSTPFGYGMANTAGNDGASLQIGTAHKLSLQPPITIMWVGMYTALPTANAEVFGVAYDLVDGAPYTCYKIGLSSSPNMELQWNNAGTSTSIGAPTPANDTPLIHVGTLTPSATAFWVNGVQAATGAGVSTINYSATSNMAFNWYGTSRANNCISNIGAVWNRELSAGEIQQVTADPFCFLRF